MRISSVSRFSGVFLALVFSFLFGCSGTEKSYCDKQKQCVGGNDYDFEACVQDLIYKGKIAGDYKCAEAWSSYLTCMESTATCRTAGSARVFETVCGAQWTSLHTCESAASTKGSGHFLTN